MEKDTQIMDYEKKYNEALERARELIAQWTGKNKDVYVEDYTYIFPELRESEDERIRKEIIEYLWDISNQTALVKESLDCRKWIAWLKRQKEQEHICDSAQYEEGFKTGLEIGLRKQKEQNPTEWSEEDEKRIQRICDFLWKNRKGDTDTIYQIEKDADWLKSLRPSWKPSEEQMRQLCDAAYLKAKISDDIYVFPELRSLYYDLQKLTEK